MILVIAYGNNLREDDGAGLQLAGRLADRLRSCGQQVACVTAHQLTPELALHIAATEVTAVVFVDTRVAQAELAPTVAVAPARPVAEPSPSVGHHFTAGMLLTYACELYGRQPLPPAWLVTVPGIAFGFGEAFSDTTRTALQLAFDGEDSSLQKLITQLAGSRAAASVDPVPPTTA